jgi:hypothetical protein
MNVMNLIKKGPKKLRGPAAVAAKKKLNNPIRKKIIDKANPFRPFIQYTSDEMVDEINNFVQNLSPINDRELIKMFNILKNGLPWPLVKSFFIEFDQSDSKNIINYFDQFYNKPEIKSRVTLMKKIINQRSVAPLTYKNEQINKNIIDQKRYIPPEKINNGINNNRTFFGSEFPSKCEQEYRRAPWMYKFTKEPIRGFALKNEIPIYTDELIKNTAIEGEWYKANMKWYKEVCKNGRFFDKGNVAYLTATGNLIIETKEMFDTSKRDWEHIIDIEFSQINEHSFDVAKTILSDNPILNNYSSKEINAILASIADNTNINYDMAKRLSWILVFLSKLTIEPQIHHYRVKNRQYDPEYLILLDRYMLLPEIYKNPNADSNEVEYIIKSRRRFIENQFYSRLQPIEIGKRKKAEPLKPEVFKYLTTDAHSTCPPNTEDVVYYEEDAILYCFNRVEIMNKRNNPITGKPFNLEFLNELSQIHTPKRTLGRTEKQEIIKEAQPDIELAPGLFQKLKEEIALLTPIYCSTCNMELFIPQKVQFCEKECFDKFQF